MYIGMVLVVEITENEEEELMPNWYTINFIILYPCSNK
jgi:hypothetical protein